MNKNIFSKLCENKNSLFDSEFLSDVTADCIRHKADVVIADEHDLNGIRKTLNIGHTTGHAFELYYRGKSHGEFVLIGMYYEMLIAEKLSVGNRDYFDRLRELINKVITVPVYKDIENSAVLAKMDKKNSDGYISLIVPENVGKTKELKLRFEEYVNLLKEC